MSYHYTDFEDRPMIIPDITAERNALYIILRDFLSDAEITQRIKDVYAGKYNLRTSGGYRPHHIDSDSDGGPPVNP